MRKYFCRKCGQLTTKTHLLCSACKKKIYAEIEKVASKPKKKNKMFKSQIATDDVPETETPEVPETAPEGGDTDEKEEESPVEDPKV